MRRLYYLLLPALLFVCAKPALGQTPTDTTGLTGTLKDTLIADQFFAQMKRDIQERNWIPAELAGNQAISIYTQTNGAISRKVADVYHQQGFIGFGKGNFRSASEAWEKALNIRLLLLGAKHPDVAKSCNNLGSAYYFMGEYEKAIDCQQKALNINLIALGAEHPYVAASYENLGTNYFAKGDFDKAIGYTEKALNIKLKALGPEHPNLAISYNNLGGEYFAKGEYKPAIGYYEKALNLFLKAFGPEYPDLATTYNNLGITYCSDGDLDQAIAFHQKGLSIREKALGPEHPDLAVSYHNLAEVYFQKGQNRQALEYQQKALDILLKAFGPEHPEIATAYNNLGSIYSGNGAYERAIDCYRQALIACRYKNRNFSAVNTLEELVKALQGLSASSLELYIRTKSPKLLADSYEFSEESLSAIDYQQHTFEQEGTIAFWKNKNFVVYEQAIRVLFQKFEVEQNEQFLKQAFSIAEKSKSGLLQAQIQASDAKHFAHIPDSLLLQEHALRIEINWREKQRRTFIENGMAETDTSVLELSNNIADLKQAGQSLLNRFEKEFPAYYRLKYALTNVPVSMVQDSMLLPRQALLEYFVGDSNIYLFVVRPDTFLVRQVKRDFPLEDWISQMREGLFAYYTSEKTKRTNRLYESTLNQYLEYAQKLYQKLLLPVEAYLPDQGSVILVPDGPLGYLPFDALLSGAPKDLNNFKSYPYLLNKHQFSYTYSAILLKEMRQKKHHQKPDKAFAAFAPFYKGDTTLLTGMYSYDELMRKDLQPLAYSGSEVAAASKLMGGQIFADAAATRENFIRVAGDYRMLHLATHGRADTRIGDYAFLAFNETQDSIGNEFLYIRDLYNLDFNADLVVLSACETGIGKLERGEGIISLARAFAYAGAKSILTTLWEVNDKSTAELMRYFYRELRRGEPKDAALRLARKTFFERTTARNGHPFFWAAFIPLGDMSPVFAN